jgi:N-acyl-D-amino-acid deacylase
MLSALLALFLLVAPLQSQLESIAAAFKGQVAMLAKNLKTGETAGVQPDLRVRTASVIKLPILAEAFHQVEEGKLRLDQRVLVQGENRVVGSGILRDLSPGLDITVEDALTLMIVLSDNSATNAVLDLIGVEKVNARMASLGLPQTKLFKKVFIAAPNPSEESKRFGLGSTTPAEMVKLLEMIERRQAADAAGCEKMLAILKKQRDRDQIPRYLAGQKVEFALKSGALDALRNDVGLIYTPAGAIALAVFCDNSPDRRWTADNEATLTIARLAKAVYDGWVGGAAPAADAVPQGGTAAAYDTVIAHAHIIDGAGNPWYPGDIAIKDGKIARIARYGSLEASSARRYIDAHGLVVAPGFIDVHTHAEAVERIPTADNYIMDGVTSVVVGNCGGSQPHLGAWFEKLQKQGASLNVASLAGHNTVRSAVMGRAARDATVEELESMRKLVDRAMREGAIGFSTGLIYVPGAYTKTPEIIALAAVASRYGGVYASHIRNEGDDEKGGVFEAVREAIEVGEKANMPVEICHFKVANKKLWGQSTKTLQLVEDARRRGLEVTVDQYPYRASSTSLRAIMPSWALADNDAKIKERLTDPATRKKIAAEMVEVIQKRNGRKHLDYAVVARAGFDTSLEGKNLTEITKMKKRKATLKNEIDTALDLELASLNARGGGISMIYFSMADEDVERIMRAPFTMVASDGHVQEFNVGMPHPRSYGTNARVLAEYVRNKRVIGLEDAVRKMTSLPAQTFRLRDRGLLREGYAADLVVFDPDKVADKATFQKPHQYSEGFSYVLVNGEPVVAEGKHTQARPGKILWGPGRAQ